MSNFTSIESFKHVIKTVERINASPSTFKVVDPVSYRGTVKLHGTNGGVEIFKDKRVQAHSRSRPITMQRDNAGFALFVKQKEEFFLRIYDTFMWEYPAFTYESITLFGEWCFYYDTPVLLADGTTRKIGLIVNNREEVDVLTYNFETEKLEPKKITGWSKQEDDDQWLTINFKKRHRGGKSTKLIVTKPHVFFCKRDGKITEIKASELKIGETVFTFGKQINYLQKQFIRGSLLGDATYSSYGIFECTHSEDAQSFYSIFIQKLLGSVAGYCRDQISGHGSNMKMFSTVSLPDIKNIQDELYTEKKKIPNKEFLNKLHAPGFAAWYMDDGTLSSGKNNRQFLSSLCTQGFSKQENEEIIEWFNEHGFETYLCRDDDKYFIRFSPEGTEAFLQMIAPYIINDFNYKLPKHLHNIPKINWFMKEPQDGIIETEILEITEGNPYTDPHKRKRYDITVEDNHNFFANKILVHNCGPGIQKGVAINQLSEKQFVIFAIRVNRKKPKANIYLSDGMIEHCLHIVDELQENNINSIFEVPTYKLKDVDFLDRASMQAAFEKAEELTQEVENCCPWGKLFDIEGLGEGIVWKPVAQYSGKTDLFFKTKGDKHKNVNETKQKVTIDLAVLESIQAFVDFAVTENRLQQGIEELKAADHPIEPKSTGQFLKWISSDVYKECQDELVENGLEWKKTVKHVVEKARSFWLKEISKI